MRLKFRAIPVVVATLAAAAFTADRGLYGWNALARHGGSLWIETGLNDARVSAAARAGIEGARAEPGELAWIERAPGFETAEMTIKIGAAQDRMRLAHLDPARWRFSVHSLPAGDRGVEEWLTALDAALVVNGSYCDRRGAPETPLVAGGEKLGPENYVGKHGAFVVDENGARLLDVKDGDWRGALAGAREGFVSYPMLIGADGRSRATSSRWVSARSFVGEDRAGRTVVGTTEDAGLTLERLADLLARAPLDLRLALNLDGGPARCQGVAVGGSRRSHCGRGEHQSDGANVQTLRPVFEGRGWGLPIVLAASRR